jgi:3-methyladenine DNA glycosylase AlkC
MAKYGTLSDARAAGLFHPNCKHSVSIFIPGISKKPKAPSKEQLQKEKDLYKKKQQQNYINRQIQKWKNRKAVAITDKEVTFTNAKLQEWYKVRRDFKANNVKM